MDVFSLRKQLTQDYANYASGFIQIKNNQIRNTVEATLGEGIFWPDPLIQLNPTFQSGGTVDQLVAQQILHPECSRIFRKGKTQGESKPLQFHQHQRDAILTAQAGENYILT